MALGHPTPEGVVRLVLLKIRNGRPRPDDRNVSGWTLQPDAELRRAINRIGFVCRTDEDVSDYLTDLSMLSDYSLYQIDQILRAFDREAKTPVPELPPSCNYQKINW